MNKKVLIIITRLDTGGSSEAVISIKQALGLKYDISILSGPGEIEPDILIPSLLRDALILQDIQALFQIYSVMRKHNPGLVHTNSSKAGFIGRLAVLMHNLILRISGRESQVAAVIHMPHGHVFYGYDFGFLKEKLFLALERLMAPAAKTLVALTNGEMNESLERGVGIKSQWVVIHPVTDIPDKLPQSRVEKRKELEIGEDSLVIGTVARLEPVKGVIYLVRAFKIVTTNYKRPINLLIVGDGSLRASIESEAKELGVYDKCIFTGTRKDVFEHLSAMDIFVQPSVNEGMGKTIIQAQASGLPVIGTRVQGIPDALKENETGVLVAPKDPEQIASAIMELVNNPSKRAFMAENATKWVKTLEDGIAKFSSERMCFLIDKLYENTLL